jgi:putative two-component system response regulator
MLKGDELTATVRRDQGSPGILVVEDDPAHGRLTMRMLDRVPYAATHAGSAEVALALAREEQFQVAIVDINLPGESGVWLIERLREISPEIAIVVASGVSDSEVASETIELGAYGYLLKPFEETQFLITHDAAIRRRRLELNEQRHKQELESTVARRTAELRAAVAELTESREETIARLMRALELRDGDTGAHVERIGALARALAGWVGFDPERAELIGLAARMHDIGKIGVPDYVLLKPGPLDAWERAEIEKHPAIGREILAGSKGELLRVADVIAGGHHERWDGEGYPDGLREEEIPVEARIVAIVDVFDAVHSDRCYRPALSDEAALEVMREGRGTRFDPGLLDVFLERYGEAMEILRERPTAG